MMSFGELVWIYVGLGCLAAGVASLLHDRVGARVRLHGWLLTAALMFGIALAARWLRTGYGPFATLFDILLSNLFSLCLVYGTVLWRHPVVRLGAPYAFAVMVLMGAWLVTVPRASSALPTAFDGYWLWAHLLTGKLFLGCAMAAATTALALLVQPRVVQVSAADLMVWRLLAIGFVLHGAMLIAGAVWAQDAWGRYWGWDPLETWSLLTWLVMGFALHLRVTLKHRPSWGWGMSVTVFVVAFLTLFGVPFLSDTPHRGLL